MTPNPVPSREAVERLITDGLSNLNIEKSSAAALPAGVGRAIVLWMWQDRQAFHNRIWNYQISTSALIA